MEDSGSQSTNSGPSKRKGRKQLGAKQSLDSLDLANLELLSQERENEHEEQGESMLSPDGSQSSIDELTSPPPKRKKFDFFAELRAAKGAPLTVSTMKPGTYWNQPLRVAVVLNRRDTDKVMIVHAYDGAQSIQIKGFGSAIEKFKQTFKNFKTYIIKGFQVRSVDEKYKSDLGADIEVIVDSDTSVDAADDNPIAVPFTPVPLNQLKNFKSGATVDVCGILVKQDEALIGRSGKLYKVIYIVDETEECVSVYLFETDAEEFQGINNTPIGIRGAVVNSKDGENGLHITSKSTVEMSEVIDPDGKMKKWFANVLEK